MTVFVGRNNTSKTYAAHTIYALHRFAPAQLAELTQELVHDQAFEQSLPPVSDVWHHELSVAGFLGPRLPSFIQRLSQRLKAGLPQVFATDDQSFAETQVELQFAEADVSDIHKSLLAQEVELPFTDAYWRGSLHKAGGSSILSIACTLTGLRRPGLEEIEPTWPTYLIGVALSSLLQRVLTVSHLNTFILSTERSAVQLFSRELYAHRSRVVDDIHETLIGTLSQVKEETRYYPLAIRDELRFINGMPRQRHVSSRLAPLAARLEALLGGAVVLDESGDLMYQPEGLSRPLPLHVSASSVKSLAGLAFYLRHIAAPGGLLVIDEPELNLHPDNQRRVARILAQVARAGVRVLISTHSDVIIRELSNLIALHAPEAAELRQKHGYSEEETLDGATVGAYLFDETHARPIDVQTTGIEVESIDDEINAIHHAPARRSAIGCPRLPPASRSAALPPGPRCRPRSTSPRNRAVTPDTAARRSHRPGPSAAVGAGSAAVGAGSAAVGDESAAVGVAGAMGRRCDRHGRRWDRHGRRWDRLGRRWDRLGRRWDRHGSAMGSPWVGDGIGSVGDGIGSVGAVVAKVEAAVAHVGAAAWS